MNWKEKGFLLLMGGIAGMILGGLVFDDDDDSDSRTESDSFDEDADFVED